MRHESIAAGTTDAVTAAAGIDAPLNDEAGSFPAAAFTALAKLGLVAHPPLGGAQAGELLWLLAAVGRGDLSVGRIYEGHVNTLFLMRSHGTPEQREHYDALAASGGLFGVWNTDLPADPLRLDGLQLTGRKNFSTGIDGLSHAIVTVTRPEGRVMIVVPLEGLPVDRSWWRPLGMRASGSHIVDFTGLRIEPDWILGRPDDYIRQPWFSAGAMRFAAVHVGGMHAVLDAAVAHLRRTDRIDDPYQKHRIARMGIAVQSGYGWLMEAAQAWTQASLDRAPPCAAERAVAAANAARTAIEGFALNVLEEAERGVGAAGLIAPHPLERLVRDLRTYLRQPNPDGALSALGAAIAEGAWEPGRRPHRPAT